MLKFPFIFSELCLLLGVTFSCQAQEVRWYQESKTVEVASDSQKLILDLDDGSVRFVSPDFAARFTASIKMEQNWTVPQKSVTPPIITNTRSSVKAEATFPVADNRTFVIELSAYKGISAVFLTSRLVNHGVTRPEYYFWQWQKPFSNYFVPGVDTFLEKTVNPEIWNWFDYYEWLYLPSDKGGLALIPSGRAGHSPNGEYPFVVGLPSSRKVAVNDSLDIGFCLAAVKTPADAQAVSNLVRSKKISALDPYAVHLAKKINYGKPAPEWLRHADLYNGYYKPKPKWTRQMFNDVLSYIPLVVGAPHDKDIFDWCQRAGIRSIAYVNYMELLNTELQVKGGGSVYYEWSTQALNEKLDLKNHPDWVCIDRDGNDLPSEWGRQHNHFGLYYTCLHAKGLRETALEQVKALLDMGADGVFVDNAGPIDECFGHKFGKHTHSEADRSNTEMYEDLMRDIYKLVKSYGEDKIVMLNATGAWLSSHWEFSDAQMWESCLFGSGMKERNHHWNEVFLEARKVQGAVKAGKVPVILSYVSEQDDIKQASLFSYAYSRLFGLLWADWFAAYENSNSCDFALTLYRLRLGKPLEEARERRGVWYRRFENGLVVLNPSSKSIEVSLPVAAKPSELKDILDYSSPIKCGKDGLRIVLPADSARIYADALALAASTKSE